MLLATANKFGELLNKLKNKPTFTNEDISKLSIDIRNILVEADIPLEYVNIFIDSLVKKISDVDFKIQDRQAVVAKILHNHITETLGGATESIKFDQEERFLIIGPNGVGKTSFLTKFANLIKVKNQKSVCCMSLDKIRPAAQTQLKQMCNTANIPYADLQSDNINENLETAAQVIASNEFEVILIDTPGLNHNDQEAVERIKKIYNELECTQVVFVIDAIFGSNSLNIIKEISKSLPISWITVTKSEADQRGGIFMSCRYACNGKIPIRYITTGEKINDIEEFNPDNITRRLMGQGDLKYLMNSMESVSSKQSIEEVLTRMQSTGKLNFNDLANQLKYVEKLGGIAKIASVVPGISGMISKVTPEMQEYMKLQIAIINSMTPEERIKPELVMQPDRAQRIAKGAGVDIQMIFELKKRLDDASAMLQKTIKKLT